jgi:hypothetical protein
MRGQVDESHVLVRKFTALFSFDDQHDAGCCDDMVMMGIHSGTNERLFHKELFGFNENLPQGLSTFTG